MRVVFVAAYVTRYRVRFHELVRDELNRLDLDYVVLSGEASAGEASKRDAGELSWAIPVRTRYLFGATTLLWQNIFPHLRRGDLVVLMQQNRCLSNYVLQASARRRGCKLALFGHGRNFQEPRATLGERWKRWWATKVDWWFAYTQRSAELVTSYGFPADRITVFQNAIDTAALRKDLAAVSEADMDHFREIYCSADSSVGLYIGGLYEEKRLGFLLRAAELVKAEDPEFCLIVIGDGPQRPLVEDFARSRSWVRYLGNKYGTEKATALRAADLFLMPGAVGLAVLDAAVAGIPMVTTSFPRHGPEIAYLQDGASGVIVSDWSDANQYAQAVLHLLNDEQKRSMMGQVAAANGRNYTIEEMARRFAAGAADAIARGPRGLEQVGS